MREQAVDGAERHRVDAMLGRCLGKVAHGAGIADAAIAGAAQAVDLGRHAPHPLAAADVPQGDAARWRHGEGDLAIGEAQAVIARPPDAGQRAATQDDGLYVAVFQRQLGRMVVIDAGNRDRPAKARGEQRRRADRGIDAVQRLEQAAQRLRSDPLREAP